MISKEACEILLKEAEEELDNMEVKSAPSGEYYEYNYAYEIQSAVVETLKEVLNG